ncbi:MAG TPA: FAD-dependent thymidylate synthase [Rubrobacteraceae bacterium]|nr:FAD-dependent thymidylate synthase [Rubrobacteraceae bacterium]
METTDQNTERIAKLFEDLGGTVADGFPTIHSRVYHTGSAVPYLKAPGVVMLARPRTNVAGIEGFLEGFDPALGFPDYVNDPTRLPDSSQLCKTAGQLCFDDQTEILTNEGWKKFQNLNRTERVLTLNPDTGNAEFQRPKAYQTYDYEGDLLHCEGKALSFAVTPNHRQWARPRNEDEYRFYSTEELEQKRFAVRTAPLGWEGRIPARISIPGFEHEQRISNQYGSWGKSATVTPTRTLECVEEIRALALLCVYYVTEGCLKKGRGEGIVVYGDHYNEISSLTETLGLKLNCWRNSRNGVLRTQVGGGRAIRSFFEEACGKGSARKRLPKWVLDLPVNLLTEVWEALVRTDGQRDSAGRENFVTTSTELAGQVQEILCKLGFSSSLMRKKTTKDRLQVFVVSKRRRVEALANKNVRIERKPYTGKVYCVTTENGIVFVRRDGKPHFSGNCYASFGPRRTTNENAAAYFERLTSAGHGSVLEHASFSFLLYGISRSVTHELVRHRAGAGFCLTGDTMVYSDHFCNGQREGVKKRSMAHLYEMTKTPHGRSRLKLLRPRSLDETTGTFTRGKVREVTCSGVKPVFRVELEDGKTITCSRDHRFLTADGWKPLHQIAGGLELSPGGFAVHGALDTEIMVNGVIAYRDQDWLKEQYIERNLSITEVAGLAGVSTATVKKWLRKHGLRKDSGVRTRWTFANDGKLYADKDWLEKQYIVEGLDQASIAQLAGVSQHTIRSWVRKHGLQKPMGSWTIGRTPWNKGRRYRAGWNHTPEIRRRLSEHKKGARNPQWRGGITRRAVTIRRGVNELRPQVLEREGYRCRLCGAHPGQLEMHHIIPVWAKPELVLDLENIATVCRPCHLAIGGREMEYAERFGVTPDEADITKAPPRAKAPLFIPRARRIKSVAYAGEQMTYDLEMEGPNHNFIANGIVTHNSQISQRYVSGAVLRFVERPEYQEDEDLHRIFEERADRAAAEYEAMAEELLEKQEGGAAMLSADYKTDARKKVQQTARSLLPNETEAPMVFTGNVRALRHIIEMRADAHAESEIRTLALRLFLCLHRADPILFGDYELGELPDGTYTVTTQHRKA